MDVFRTVFSGEMAKADGTPLIGPELLARFDEVPYLRYEFLSGKITRISPALIEGVNLLAHSGRIVDSETFSRGAEDLAYMCLFSLGYDTVDIPACTEVGVAVTRTRGISRHTVASGALLLMMALSKRLPDKQRLVREGRWDLNRRYWGNDVDGKTLGIVGLGDIGRELARLVLPFHMHLLASDPYVEEEVFRDLGVEQVGLDELLRRSDLVSLHCSLTSETYRLIGERELRLMKPTAYLVNTARGPIVDPVALAHALSEGWIAGAGIDVYDVEPLPPDSTLTKLDNIILTPHTIGTSQESVRRGSEMIVGQIVDAARGSYPDHILNPEVIDTPAFRHKLARIRSLARQEGIVSTKRTDGFPAHSCGGG